MAEAAASSESESMRKGLDTLENELQCSICTELFIKAITLNCSHTFCKYCINEWKKTRSVCPICRKPIKSECPTLVLDTYIEKVLDTHSPEVKQKRQAAILQRDKDAALDNSSHNHYTDVDSNDSDDDEENDLYSVNEDDEEWNEEQWEDLGNFSDETEVEDEEHYIADEYNPESSNDEGSGEETESSCDENEENSHASGHSYNGIPGAYYGGYGHCFHCGDSGHWANGCPLRPELTCHFCHRVGHFRKACPERLIICESCGQLGHIATHCQYY